ncbi:hypothetical protein D3C71_532910 [compost metagenome]
MRGDVGRIGKDGFDAIRFADGTVKIDQPAPAKDLFAGDAAFDGFDMRENRIVACASRADIDMPAFARHRKPHMAGINQPGNTKPCAWPKNDARSQHIFFAGADGVAVIVVQCCNRESLRFKVIDDDDVLQAEIGQHVLRFDNPMAVGERNLVTFDRAGNRKNGRDRLKRGLVQNRLLDGVVDRRIFRRLHGGEVHRFRKGIDQNGKAGVGTADVAKKDRKGQIFGIGRLRHCLFHCRSVNWRRGSR